MQKVPVFAVVFLATLSSAVISQTAEKFLIVPGQGIGLARLGIPLSAVISALGPPDKKPLEGSNFAIGTWSTGSQTGFLHVLINTGMAETGLPAGVLAVSLDRDMRYATVEGLHTGSSTDEVRAAFGQPPAMIHRSSSDGDYDLMQYWQRSINLAVRQDSVFRMLVCPRGLSGMPRAGLRWCELLAF